MDEIGQAETLAPLLLLAEEGYMPSAVGYHHIIPVTMGIKQFEQSIDTIAAFQPSQHLFGLLTQLLLLGLRLVVHRPGIEEIVPVDIRSHLADVVVNLHGRI